MNGGPAALARHFVAVTDEIPRSAHSCFSSIRAESSTAFVDRTRALPASFRFAGTRCVAEASSAFRVSSWQSRGVAILDGLTERFEGVQRYLIREGFASCLQAVLPSTTTTGSFFGRESVRESLANHGRIHAESRSRIARESYVTERMYAEKRSWPWFFDLFSMKLSNGYPLKRKQKPDGPRSNGRSALVRLPMPRPRTLNAKPALCSS